MLLPLFLVSFSVYPAHDDFALTLDVTEAWLRTGSLWAAGEAAIDRAIYMYNTWQGTISASLLLAIQPMVFSPNLYFLTPMITLCGLCLAVAYFSKALIYHILKSDTSVCAVFFSVMLTMLLQFLPSAREVIYWHSGISYSLSVILLLLILGNILKLHLKQSRCFNAFRSILLFFCGAMLGSCPYPLALAGVVGLFFVTIWTFAKRSPARWGCLCALMGIALALTLVVIAPGNFIRQGRIGQPMGPLRAILQSIYECMKMTGKWFSPQLIATILILLPLLTPVLRNSRLPFKRPFLFLLASFGVLAAAFVPPIYATGTEGYQVGRVLSSLYMLYVLLMLLNLVYLTGFLLRRFGFEWLYPNLVEKKGLSLCIVALSAILLVWGLFASAIMTTPSIAATRSLLSGESARYRVEMAQREALIVSSESRSQAISAIHPLSVEPVLFPRDMLPYQKESSLPSMMRRLFRMHQLGEEYGPGNIPQSQWEALGFWPEN